MKQRSYADLTEGLDDIEDATNDPERMKQQDMIDMWRMLSLTFITMASGWGITIDCSDQR